MGATRSGGARIGRETEGAWMDAQALAYMECEVTSRMEGSDHWIVYSTVQTGRVAKLDALTTVHHRKVGNYY